MRPEDLFFTERDLPHTDPPPEDIHLVEEELRQMAPDERVFAELRANYDMLRSRYWESKKWIRSLYRLRLTPQNANARGIREFIMKAARRQRFSFKVKPLSIRS